MPGILITVWIHLVYSFNFFSFMSEDPEKTILRKD